MKALTKTTLALLCLSQTLCLTGHQKLEEKMMLRQVALPEYGITLMLPGNWSITLHREQFYQCIATGFTPEGSLGTFEFRSLPNSLRDPAGKNLFATGWYQSPQDNFRGWKYLKKSRVETDPEGTYEFEGMFSRDGVEYFRMGRLRFRKNRVHALYYTVPLYDAEDLREYLEVIDSHHVYSVDSGKEEKPG